MAVAAISVPIAGKLRPADSSPQIRATPASHRENAVGKHRFDAVYPNPELLARDRIDPMPRYDPFAKFAQSQHADERLGGSPT
jgi:hypothetical protein